MHEWVRRWEITMRWERPSDSPWGCTRYSTRVDSPAQLRALVLAARADRGVVGLKYGAVRELVGEAPTQCPHGHSLEGGSATRAGRDWLRCACGGHVVYTCRWQGCGEHLVDPPPGGPECGPELVAATATARRP